MPDPHLPDVRLPDAHLSAPWRVILVDDEPLARLRLRTLLERHPRFAVVEECADGEQALVAIATQRPDVVFLDVRMPGIDGIEVAEALAADEPGGGDAPAPVVPALVFVTAYDVHAVRAFDLDAIDYLVKPVDIDRFDRAMDRLSARLAARDGATAGRAALHAALASLAAIRPGPRHPARFPVRDARGVYFVAAADVDRVEAEGNYVALCVRGRRHLVRASMREMESKLDPDRFVRVHRSAIVAVDRIRRLEPCGHGEYRITLADGSTLTSSRTHGARIQALVR